MKSLLAKLIIYGFLIFVMVVLALRGHADFLESFERPVIYPFYDCHFNSDLDTFMVTVTPPDQYKHHIIRHVEHCDDLREGAIVFKHKATGEARFATWYDLLALETKRNVFCLAGLSTFCKE
jgi:hypothetical protein